MDNKINREREKYLNQNKAEVNILYSISNKYNTTYPILNYLRNK